MNFNKVKWKGVILITSFFFSSDTLSGLDFLERWNLIVPCCI